MNSAEAQLPQRGLTLRAIVLLGIFFALSGLAAFDHLVKPLPKLMDLLHRKPPPSTGPRVDPMNQHAGHEEY